MAVYLVRSFRTYARIRSLTTGTFNRVVKDRIAFRLSGAPSVLDGFVLRANPQARIRLSSKPFNHIVRAKPCQPAHPTAFPPVFHMRNGDDQGAPPPRFCHSEQPHREGICFLGELKSTQRYSLPLQRRQVRRTPKRKTEN